MQGCCWAGGQAQSLCVGISEKASRGGGLARVREGLGTQGMG